MLCSTSLLAKRKQRQKKKKREGREGKEKKRNWKKRKKRRRNYVPHSANPTELLNIFVHPVDI